MAGNISGIGRCNCWCSTHLLLFIQSVILPHGCCHPHSEWVFLPHQLNIFYTKCIYMLGLNPTRLTMKINAKLKNENTENGSFGGYFRE